MRNQRRASKLKFNNVRIEVAVKFNPKMDEAREKMIDILEVALQTYQC